MIEKVIEYGKKWSKIAKILGNRTQHMIKNRFNSLINTMVKRSRYAKNDTSLLL